MSITFKTYKGIWVKTNSFMIEDGKTIFIAPYQNLIDMYKHKLPMECYILVHNPLNTVKEVLEIY